MHAEAFDFCRRVKAALPTFFESGRVLEVGSLDVNATEQGLSVRGLFAPTCDVVGVDRQAGAGVDVVCDAAALPFAGDSFDVCYSTETLEHAAQWSRLVAELQRVAKPGALVFVTAATYGRVEHGRGEYGFGYYKNVSPSALRSTIKGKVQFFEEDFVACDVRAAWLKK